MTGYLPLAEAAQYVTTKTGKECEPDALLRAGVHGALHIAAAFSGQMRNLTAHKNEDYSGLLTIPPRYLLEIDTHGKAIIEGAFSLDGKNGYAPLKIRTREQLRVLVSELDRFIPYIVEITPQHQAAPSGTPKSSAPNGIDGDEKQSEVRTRAVLIAEVESFWPSIERDLSDAARNGLRDAAKHPEHRFWYVEPAIKWATKRGKIIKGKAQSFIASNEESCLSPMLRILLKLD